MEYTLFLSHNATDAHLVHEVKRRSEALGICVYMHENEAQASVSIADKLRLGDAMLVLQRSIGLRCEKVRNGVIVAVFAVLAILALLYLASSES